MKLTLNNCDGMGLCGRLHPRPTAPYGPLCTPLRLSRRPWIEHRFDIHRSSYTLVGKGKADPLLGSIETVTGIA